MAYTKVERLEKALESQLDLYIVYTRLNKSGWDYSTSTDPPIMVGRISKAILTPLIDALNWCHPEECTVDVDMRFTDTPSRLSPVDPTEKVTITFGSKAGDAVLKTWSTRSQSDRYRTRKMVNLGVVVQTYAHTVLERMLHVASCTEDSCPECKQLVSKTSIDEAQAKETLAAIKEIPRVHKALSETIDGLQQLQI
jgi:hypothetical protein